MKNVLYLNKPAGITSFTLCKRVGKVLQTRKIGHTGTLDPMATGVMILLLDKATKANQFLVADRKEYIAQVQFGFVTDTLDKEGKILRTQEIKAVNEVDLRRVLQSFLGKSEQIPPLTSAIKVQGKRLYEYQRQGKEIQIPHRNIEVFRCELLHFSGSGFTFRTQVSSGTYIRSLVRDIGARLGNLACLTALERISIDQISLAQCDNFSLVPDDYHFHDVCELLSLRYPSFELSDDRDVRHGKPLFLPCTEKEIFLKKDGEALAIYRREENGSYRCVRGLF